MPPRLVAGSANLVLASKVAERLETTPVDLELERYEDGECRPRVESVGGEDVYVLQPTGPPAAEHVVELLLLLDACRRAGAARLTAVVPYFGYARQERRTRPGEPIGARLIADTIALAGAQRLVVVDPHPAGFEALCPIPTEVVTAEPVLTGTLGAELDLGVVVAPDLGGLKRAERIAAHLRLPVAVVRKVRLGPSRVEASELLGEVAGLRAVLVDDMIATGATIEAAARLIADRGGAPGLVVVATHGVFVGPALERLERVAPSRIVVTDTLAPSGAGESRVPIERPSVAGLLAEVIDRLSER